jgi:Cu2+-exporting ATPase
MTAVDLSHFITAEDGTAHIDLAVEGIDCAACIGDIEGGLKKVPGVLGARVNYTLRRVGVDWREGALDPSALLDALARLGYRGHPYAAATAETRSSEELKSILKALAIAGFAAMNVMLLSVSVWAGNVTDITPETRDFFHWVSALIALPAAAFAGRPFFASAFKALRTRRTNMDVPISIGVTLALGVSVYETAISAEHAYFDSVLMLLFFLLLGRALDLAMRRKTRTLAGNLAALKAEQADRLQADGSLVSVPAASLVPGDTISVTPGARIPVDSVVLAGASTVDTSLVTGETDPRPVAAGDTVYAGTLNLSGALRLSVAAASGKSLVDEIQSLLDRATEARSRRVELADRAARLYAPVVHLTAALSAAGWLLAGAGVHQAVLIAATVLIITCPCALALAVPTVQVVASGALFRRGIFLNRGGAIERLAEVDTIVFDKTGTLTLPEPRAVNLDEVPPHMVALARRLAASSHHPLAVALRGGLSPVEPIPGAVETPGEGVSAIVDGVEARLGSVHFCGFVDHAPVHGTSTIGLRLDCVTVLFRFRQQLRPDAAATVTALRDRGYDVRILSGDREEAVAPVAAALGVETWAAGVKPSGKVEALQALAASGRRVAMVGDGLNDAPSLAAAHVSLSPIDAVDLAKAEADVVFLGERLNPVVEALDISRKARSLMTMNLWLSVVYNLFAVPLAILGLVTPLIAALAMSGSSVIVTLNAVRARPRADYRPATTAPDTEVVTA